MLDVDLPLRGFMVRVSRMGQVFAIHPLIWSLCSLPTCVGHGQNRSSILLLLKLPYQVKPLVIPRLQVFCWEYRGESFLLLS